MIGVEPSVVPMMETIRTTFCVVHHPIFLRSTARAAATNTASVARVALAAPRGAIPIIQAGMMTITAIGLVDEVAVYLRRRRIFWPLNHGEGDTSVGIYQI